MATSYNGWPASPNPAAISINRGWEPIPGNDFPGGIKSGDVQDVFTYLVRQLHARVEPITRYPAGDEWGYAYRDNVNNPGQLSCHASGTAIDYNATLHPNRQAYTWTREQVREIHQILDECSGVVRWLEGYDEMHFEIRGTAAQVAAAAAKLRKPPIVPEETDMATVLRRKENPKQSILIPDFAKGPWYMSTDGGISSSSEVLVDVSAWAGIVNPNQAKIVKV